MVSIPELPLRCACRCGDVTIEITAQPIMTAACHCKGCQRMSASAFSLTVMIPSSGLAVTKGSPVRGGLRAAPTHHHHCPACMSWMFTRFDGLDEYVNVRPTLFEDIAWFSPFIETMSRNRLPWATTPAPHSVDAFPPMSEYQRLMEVYAEQ